MFASLKMFLIASSLSLFVAPMLHAQMTPTNDRPFGIGVLVGGVGVNDTITIPNAEVTIKTGRKVTSYDSGTEVGSTSESSEIISRNTNEEGFLEVNFKDFRSPANIRSPLFIGNLPLDSVVTIQAPGYASVETTLRDFIDRARNNRDVSTYLLSRAKR